MANLNTTHSEHEEHTTTGLNNRKMLMWACLGSDCMFFAALSYVSRPHKLIFKLLMDEEMNLLVAKILLTDKV